ncbi:MAG: NADP-dependent malic enzyme [Deltaproteobacteria bacterium]|jgi:malate dehydrogenase (oxaloacetate-decarboxylating)|nr:NADP-dependent malic enzyme [Deltaproteobacteria bacterium]
MDYAEESLRLHYKWRGKLDIRHKMPVATREDLSLAYTPGVAAACVAIRDDPAQSYGLTGRWNTVAVVTDGSAVLGLGDIGPLAGLPVMEGKCVLFKAFGGVDAFPLCVGSREADEIVRAVSLVSGSFGGINLEDIAAPRCFEVERRLKAELDIPVFHDDQHGTAVVVLAALRGALKLAGKSLGSARAVISGAGAAGAASARLLLSAGLGDAVLCDRRGAIWPGRPGLDPEKEALAAVTNRERFRGTLEGALRGADVFIGVSAAGLVTGDMVRSMARSPVVFAMANPVPEILPEEALAAGAAVVGTGRSDFPNQINNVLAFPGIFRGALDVRASDINEPMKIAASEALASIAEEDGLTPDRILPLPFDARVRERVAAAAAAAAESSGVARARRGQGAETARP